MKMTRALSLMASGGLVLTLAACGGDGGEEVDEGGSTGGGAAAGDTTITWWHNSNTGEGLEYYQQLADDFAEENGVTIQVEAMQHEDMLTQLDAAFQAGDAPDIYMERGGGELADHVEAGLTRDLTEDAAEEIELLGGTVQGWTVEDRVYALPFSVGVVGFWYNTEMFEEAGITEPPATWDEMYEAIDQLKAAGMEPISVGAGDGWPAAHYWYQFALRHCAEDVLTSAVQSLDFSDQCFISAGEDVERLIAAEPFNRGFLSTPAQSGPTSASGLLATEQVAMEMQGHWEPGVMAGLTEDGEGLGDKLGWFPFPEVEGGQGDTEAQLGGGDAWGVSADAPDEAVDFVRFLLSDEVQRGFAERDMGLPTNPNVGDAVQDPALAGLLEVRDSAPYVQLYFDTAFGQSVGGAMNDAIELMFAGQATPQDIVADTQAAADSAG
ncbi:sugar ABC transporter substrate-binding protein [Ornithinimicrobium cerasi]|uniref:Carbohydrate ABC transporter substrate-binding protein, CUT1 family n=1 Tax=Ornithinimicrobium cerasi TaxID=2248773 RepID=A0A285VIV4_9MICO|nr:extracellular solute-binding protein [Ornithinimicrobium cerasi]SOC53797.1 carbohydrate ABC transporter substrate-binding protein, CUT1 family [Ornithinimicrobium cerasi]